MRYFCYIHSAGSAVPHMEAIDCACLDDAEAWSGRLFADHSRAVLAELLGPDGQVTVITREQAEHRLGAGQAQEA